MSEYKTTVEPKWKENSVAIAMSSSEEYIPYLSVYLQSIVEHSSKENYYDIIIFSTTENENLKNTLKENYSSSNISIRFVNPEEYFKNIEFEVTHPYFHRVCYYRLAAPNILRNFEKVIFTDIDLIAQADFAKLYNIDLTGHPLAACVEPIWKVLIKEDAKVKTKGGDRIRFKQYSEEVLKLEDINRYYNTGVVVFNVKYYNEHNCFEKAIELIKKNHFFYQEQCALNALLNNEILPLAPEWNYEIDIYASYPENTQQSIMHYLGKDKPWLTKNNDYNQIWWEYAKKTSFAEQIDNNYTNYINKNKKTMIKKYKPKVIKYSILSKITLGEKRKYYLDKLTKNVQFLKEAQSLFVLIYIYIYITQLYPLSI